MCFLIIYFRVKKPPRSSYERTMGALPSRGVSGERYYLIILFVQASPESCHGSSTVLIL